MKNTAEIEIESAGQVIKRSFTPVSAEIARDVIHEALEAFRGQEIQSIEWRGVMYTRAIDGSMVRQPPVIMNDGTPERY